LLLQRITRNLDGLFSLASDFVDRCEKCWRYRDGCKNCCLSDQLSNL